MENMVPGSEPAHPRAAHDARNPCSTHARRRAPAGTTSRAGQREKRTHFCECE
ncbi:hypothetical protein A3768_4332 (plasmid) [Ralstonia solanacearum]|nr:hypothetical protein A3768_4332 [Ralstonia solanacearum]